MSLSLSLSLQQVYLEEDFRDDHAHWDGGLREQDDQATVLQEVDSEALHDAGRGVEKTHDSKLIRIVCVCRERCMSELA